LRSEYTPLQRRDLIILMIANGDSNKEIAAELNLCDSTIRHDVTVIMNSFGAKNRANLVALAYQKGILVAK